MIKIKPLSCPYSKYKQQPAAGIAAKKTGNGGTGETAYMACNKIHLPVPLKITK